MGRCAHEIAGGPGTGAAPPAIVIWRMIQGYGTERPSSLNRTGGACFAVHASSKVLARPPAPPRCGCGALARIPTPVTYLLIAPHTASPSGRERLVGRPIATLGSPSMGAAQPNG